MRDKDDHDYELTEALKQRLKRQRAAKDRSFIAKANLTPEGAKQYAVPAGCNRVRVVQTGTLERVRLEFLPAPEPQADSQADSPA